MTEDRPAPRPWSEEALSHPFGTQRFGTLATVKSSGHPHPTSMVHQACGLNTYGHPLPVSVLF
ncbi:hypothetical protein [Streptomyces sp. P9-A2]|uniref:hypothetical protein n=1 Tax=Streptomyces sp. P9-A2 TaxID=3072284 RepID=UPI002FC670B0